MANWACIKSDIRAYKRWHIVIFEITLFILPEVGNILLNNIMMLMWALFRYIQKGIGIP